MKYTPIACSFHDLLLDRATRKASVDITYSDQGKELTINTIIKDVYTKEGEEFLLTTDKRVIRLDHLRSVDGIALHPSS